MAIYNIASLYVWQQQDNMLPCLQQGKPCETGLGTEAKRHLLL